MNAVIRGKSVGKRCFFVVSVLCLCWPQPLHAWVGRFEGAGIRHLCSAPPQRGPCKTFSLKFRRHPAVSFAPATAVEWLAYGSEVLRHDDGASDVPCCATLQRDIGSSGAILPFVVATDPTFQDVDTVQEAQYLAYTELLPVSAHFGVVRTITINGAMLGGFTPWLGTGASFIRSDVSVVGGLNGIVTATHEWGHQRGILGDYLYPGSEAYIMRAALHPTVIQNKVTSGECDAMLRP